MTQKVIVAGVFVEPANEIPNGVDEFLLTAGWRVKEQVLRQVEQGATLMVGHPLEHFELHVVQRTDGSRQHKSVGQCEEIVRRNAQTDGCQVVALHAELQHAEIIRVGIDLFVEGGQRPTM